MNQATTKETEAIAQAAETQPKGAISSAFGNLVDKVVAARTATAAAVVAEWAPIESKRSAAEKPKLP